MRVFTAAGLITLTLTISMFAWGANALPVTVPDFQVGGTDGSQTSSTKVVQSGNWLLVYTKRNCPSCDRFLRVLGQTGGPVFASHIIVFVAGATSAQLTQISAAFPDLVSSRWYADASETGVAALQINAMPVIFGAHDSTLNWSIIGVPSGDSVKLKAILRSWILG
jgi:hypothetical protein